MWCCERLPLLSCSLTFTAVTDGTFLTFLFSGLYYHCLIFYAPHCNCVHVHLELFLQFYFLDHLLFFYYFLNNFFLIWTRATLPRYRYDKLIFICWKVILTLSLTNTFLSINDAILGVAGSVAGLVTAVKHTSVRQSKSVTAQSGSRSQQGFSPKAWLRCIFEGFRAR